VDKDECKFEYVVPFLKATSKEKAIITNVYYELSREWKPNINYKDIKQELDNFHCHADAE
jgi:hypothetical protein